ncbi:MAG: lysophospholipid acyltransferase family protein [Acidobacteriota bacterium]
MRWGTSAEAEPKPRQASPLRRLLVLYIAPAVTLAIVRILDWTWRYREIDRPHFDAARGSGKPVVGAFLHGRIFLLLRFMSRPRNGRWLSMCSKSLDGDAMAKVEEALGFEVVRGSSGRDGLQAIVDMIRRVRKDPELGSCLAIDGSRGPRGVVQGGIVSLAQRTGGLIVPITAAARPGKIFTKAWDRTLLPWPGAKVFVIYGEPMEVPAKLNAEAFESLRTELEGRLVELQKRVDGICGSGDGAYFAPQTAS